MSTIAAPQNASAGRLRMVFSVQAAPIEDVDRG